MGTSEYRLYGDAPYKGVPACEVRSLESDMGERKATLKGAATAACELIGKVRRAREWRRRAWFRPWLWRQWSRFHRMPSNRTLRMMEERLGGWGAHP